MVTINLRHETTALQHRFRIMFSGRCSDKLKSVFEREGRWCAVAGRPRFVKIGDRANGDAEQVGNGCYEIYGSNKQNKLVEVYFNLVTGEIVPSLVPVVPP